jgi:hypothetical protein
MARTPPGGFVPQCPKGSTYVERLHRCVPNDPSGKCPPGMWWNELTQTCDDYSNQQPPPEPPPNPGGGNYQPPFTSDGFSCLPGWHGVTVDWWDVDKYSESELGNPNAQPGGSGTRLRCIKDTEVPQDGPDGQCCSESSMCANLDEILSTVAKALDELTKKVGDEYADCDKLFTKCQDELEEIIGRQIDRELKKYTKCQEQALAGLCGTTEYELNCAKYALKCAEEECYEVGIGNKPGKCHKCEKEPCCCTDGKCLPCEDEPEENKQHYGWCNPLTGIIAVTHGDQEPPGPAFQQVAITDTELAAIELAKQYCNDRTSYPTPPTQPGNIPAMTNTIGCNLQGYEDSTNIQRLVNSFNANDVSIGMARVNEALGDFGLAGLTANDLGKVMEGVFQASLGMPPKIIQHYAKTASEIIGCPSSPMISAITGFSTFGMIAKLTGADLSFLSAPYQYSMSSWCRNKNLDPDKAIAAYLANAISAKDLDTHWSIHGMCPESVLWYTEASRAKPVPLELMTMKMRHIISESDYYKGMRSLGYTNQQDSKNLLALRQQLPTMSDIIRFMVRDADDEQLATDFNLDEGFTKKYGKQLRDWSEQQGVPEQVAKYVWRAHWDIPSPTALFQFWKRLRKDKAFGGENKLWKDIENAMIQQDILPFWHKHYQAIAFTPLGRVDIRRMLNIGSIQEKELEPLYSQLGYSDENAKMLAEFAIRDRNAAVGRHPLIKLWTDFLIDRGELEARLKQLNFPDSAIKIALDNKQYDFDDSQPAKTYVAGLLNRQEFEAILSKQGVEPGAIGRIIGKLSYRLNPTPALQKYAVGMINRNAAGNELAQIGVDAQVATALLRQTDTQISIARITACTRAIKQKYVTGAVDKMGAQNELSKVGVDNQRAVEISDGWSCEQAARGKHVAVNKLCGWLERGAIGPNEFLQRLGVLGYDPNDAKLIMQDCLSAIDVKRQKEADKRVADDLKRQQQQQKLIQQATAKAQRAAVNANNQLQKARATNDRRQKQLLSATEKAVKKCNCTLNDVYNFVMDNNRRIQQEWGLSKDESIIAMLNAVEAWSGPDLIDLTNGVNLAASLLQATEVEMSDPLVII